MDEFWPIIGVIATIAIAAASLLLRKDDPYGEAARALGLKLSRSVPDLLPRLEGMLHGLPVRVEVTDRTDRPVRYTVFYPPLGMALRLQRETTISRTLGDLGERDMQLGDRPFDDSFRINTSRPDVLDRVLTTEVRSSLVRLIDLHPEVSVEDGAMTLLDASPEPSADQITRTISHMAEAARLLDANRPPPLQIPPATRPQATPRAAPPQATGPEDTPDQESEHGIPPAGRSESPAPPPLPEAEPSDLPAGFFDDVFGTNRLSFEADNRFEIEFRGKRVTLGGTVKQARRQQADVDSVAGEVTRAVVTVAQINNELYGTTDIDAVVYLPSGGAAELERGDTIRFRGTLDKVDPFMRNLFVIDATRVD